MRIEETGIAGLVLLHWEVSRDDRGSFSRIFCRAELGEAGILFELSQANLSVNTARHTLRGLHLQNPPHCEPKIVSCLRGRLWDVAVDMRPDSASYRHWRGYELGEGTNMSVHLPTGVAHGFLTLEPDSQVHYLMGGAFVPDADTGIRWNDPAIGIEWPAAPAVISPRDREFPLLAMGDS